MGTALNPPPMTTPGPGKRSAPLHAGHPLFGQGIAARWLPELALGLLMPRELAPPKSPRLDGLTRPECPEDAPAGLPGGGAIDVGTPPVGCVPGPKLPGGSPGL